MLTSLGHWLRELLFIKEHLHQHPLVVALRHTAAQPLWTRMRFVPPWQWHPCGSWPPFMLRYGRLWETRAIYWGNLGWCLRPVPRRVAAACGPARWCTGIGDNVRPDTRGMQWSRLVLGLRRAPAHCVLIKGAEAGERHQSQNQRSWDLHLASVGPLSVLLNHLWEEGDDQESEEASLIT